MYLWKLIPLPSWIVCTYPARLLHCLYAYKVVEVQSTQDLLVHMLQCLIPFCNCNYLIQFPHKYLPDLTCLIFSSADRRLSSQAILPSLFFLIVGYWRIIIAIPICSLFDYSVRVPSKIMSKARAIFTHSVLVTLPGYEWAVNKPQ